ncbi:MAG: VWA domain-containing protein [Acidimicrobiales bacterium]
MRFGNPAGLALLALAIPVILTHILRPRRMPVTVSSTLLWRKLERPVAAAKPWQRLRWSLLLLAQLLAVAGLATAVARPERVEASPLAEHTVFIIDASGSMAATDGTPDRLADAVDRAIELRDELPSGGLASIVIAGANERVALTASPDRAEFERALRTIDQSYGHPEFGDAFALAESLDTGSTPIGFVFISDGGVDATEARMLPPGTRIERIGDESTNRAIARLMVDTRRSGLHARVTVRNTGGPSATQTVRVDVDGATVDSQEITLDPGEQTDVEFDIPDGDLVEAFLEGGDLLSADDHAVAVAKQLSDVRILLAGDPLFWEQLLAAIPGVTVETTDESAPADSYDLAIYSGVAVPADPGAPFIAVAPPGGLRVDDPDSDGPAVSDEIVAAGEVARPAVTLVRTDDALLTGIDLSDVAIASAQRVDAGSADVLVAGEDAPLLLRGRFAGERYVYLTFGLRDSNLGVQLAFPLLGERLVGQLSGTEAAGLALTVGDRLPVPALSDEDATVTGPNARPVTVEPGQPAPRALRPGFFRISVPDRPDVVVAVNVPASESSIDPADVEAPSATMRGEAEPRERSTSMVNWVLWPLLAIVAVEVVLAWRRVGVGRKQWYVAVALRALVAALLVTAIVNPTVRRPAERVATVFVVDGSASIGAAGAAAAEQFVNDALAERPGSSLAGMVVFGAEARVDHVMDEADSFGGPTAVIDRSATDVEAGLRLGAALLPSDARRRVVLVSDGRPTAGDVIDEIKELEAAGIPVDVVTLESARGSDAAIARIDVPEVARPDERVPVVVHVEASEAGRATVVLRRDGEIVARQDVELDAGSNDVRFEDLPGADAGAVMRYEATVIAASDTIPENDTGFAAVAVDGPARVLVIEGSGGASDTLVAALDAGGIGAHVVGVGNIPGVQDLVTYAGVVMVDVDARDLSGEKIGDITTAVRDMGRGLVTIGGTHSYGVGGYLGSPLNDLLPVDSEVVDPLRRRTVAEVLSIDTSESMGACHCGPGLGAPGNITEGGVSKTDISRAAAARTIEALADTDEVGVLAWNSSAEWVVPLQALPPQDVVDRGLRSLQPTGNTDLRDSLTDAAEALLASDAELKHIILFSDGFTDPGAIDDVAEQAAELYAEHGITVSVLATGEGAAPALEQIAEAGNGRFYAGTDLQDVPQIMAEEAVIASRNFITEGEFVPEVTSDDDVVAGLTESPPLLGYVATTAKGQAEVMLRIGPDNDPLLATWQAGLGRVTSWTSDVTNWTQQWSSWGGYVDFFTTVVKDTLPAGDNAGAVQAQVRDGQVAVSVESAEEFPDGATATARVSGPDGQSMEVELERTDEGRFEGVADAPRPGTYAVSAEVTGGEGETVLSASTLTSNSYPAEYVPGSPDAALMGRVASLTGGRAEIEAAAAWHTAGLTAGRRLVNLLPWLLLAAALLWPVAVILSRLSVRGATVAGARDGLANVAGRVRDLLPKIGGQDPNVGAAPPRPPSPTPAPEEVPPEREPAAVGSALDSLLSAKRDRRQSRSEE